MTGSSTNMNRAMERSLEQQWIDRYRADHDALAAASAPALNAPRKAALEAFERLGIPAKGSDNGDRYHYTDLRAAFAGEYRRAAEAAAPKGSSTGLDCPGHRIELSNGFCREARLYRLDNGVMYGSLAAAAQEEPQLVARYYGGLTQSEEDAFSALAAMWALDGVFIYVPAGVKEPLPFVIESELGDGRDLLSVYARHLYIFERGSAAQVVLHHRSDGDASSLSCQTREVVVDEEAHAEMVEVYQLGPQAVSVSGSYVRQAGNSRFESLSVSLSGSLLRHNLVASLDGRGVENHMNGVMLAGGTETFDYATDIRHRVPDGSSHEQFKSIAAGDGTAVFSGRIYVAPDAQRTNAYQQNNALLLTPGAHVDTKPQLEIYADDVKCSHGATVGQLDPEAIYYMRQRGLSLDEARRLQMYGFVREVLDKTRIEGLAETLDRLAEDKIDRL